MMFCTYECCAQLQLDYMGTSDEPKTGTNQQKIALGLMNMESRMRYCYPNLEPIDTASFPDTPQYVFV